MKRTIFVFASILITALFFSSCLVSEDKYVKKSEEAASLAKELAAQKEINKSLAGENLALKESTVKLEKKSKEVEAASKTYKELLQEMKGEIAQGQITITELKGKLTMDVVDKILFDSGEAEVKEEGLAVLKRVVDILKNVKDKNIRIEGPIFVKKNYVKWIRHYEDFDGKITNDVLESRYNVIH